MSVKNERWIRSIGDRAESRFRQYRDEMTRLLDSRAVDAFNRWLVARCYEHPDYEPIVASELSGELDGKGEFVVYVARPRFKNLGRPDVPARSHAMAMLKFIAWADEDRKEGCPVRHADDVWVARAIDEFEKHRARSWSKCDVFRMLGEHGDLIMGCTICFARYRATYDGNGGLAFERIVQGSGLCDER